MKINRFLRHAIFACAALAASFTLSAADGPVIRISTDATDLVLKVADSGRLYETYLGAKLQSDADAARLGWDEFANKDGMDVKRGGEAYATAGSEDYYQPALGIIHNDGNQTTYLYYQGHEQKAVEGGTETIISLADDVYPVFVKLHYVAYPKENIIKTWTEISHNEKKAVTLTEYASALLHLWRGSYHLVSFSSDWAKEAQMHTEQLFFGRKILESKQGSRAAEFCHPFFELGLDGEPQENSGEVLMGNIGWNGNFSLEFEVDHHGMLRIIPGINNFASAYKLQPGEVFRTPEFFFTLSHNGVGEGSRNFQRWARSYQVKKGNDTRMSLLNNWENTYFNFDQAKLAGIMKEGARLGVDLFLLDDGWFGNGEDARKDDTAGLGDWEVNHAKLPEGVPGLVRAAREAGVKFGIWIEPEMVNPQSKLFRKHPDWATIQPNRERYHFRNQLTLDMANPKVQDYVFSIVDGLMTENPELAFFKWDCNSPITNKFSPYLKENQSQMYIDHVRGVYNVMERVTEKYPDLDMMLCSGGGARCDYESLKHFTEFWCSDNTDPVERCYIQWGFSQFFPAKTMCAHVTSWNRDASVKFRVDVASMCKLGFDIGLQDLTDNEISYCQQAISNWKRLQNVILDGDQYRLMSPYETDHMAIDYVSTDRSRAVLFVYNLFPRYGEESLRLKLQGLDPDRNYRVEEINLETGRKSGFGFNGKEFSGDYLMTVGLPALGTRHMSSNVLEITAK